MADKSMDDAKQFFRQLLWARQKLAERQEDLQDLQDQCLRATGRWSGMPSGGGCPGNPTAWDRYLQEEEAYQEALNRYTRQQIKVLTVICLVPDPALRDILRLHYLEDKPWGQVAAEVGWSLRHTLRKHRQALDEAAKVLDRVLEAG